MASVFPGSIDSFANPIYTKIDGEDLVKAAHVNDLQNAIRAVEETLAGAGKPLDFASNRYIADNSSFQAVVEVLDAELGSLSDSTGSHSSYVLPTDPVQHHANVIEVTPVGNLASDRVQAALVEHQADIDNLMSGGLVEGASLDDRYLNLAGAQVVQGPITISDDLSVEGNSVLGTNATNTLDVNAAMSAKSSLEVDDNLILNSNLLLQAGQKIAEEGATDASYISFEADKLELYSHKDIVLRLDADDPTDGQTDAGKLSVHNGLDVEVFSVDEDGALTAASALLTEVSATSLLKIGVDDVVFSSDMSEYKSESLHIQLDKDDVSSASRFFITKDGDTGASLASQDLLLNLDEDSTLTSGLHVLKEGIQETGYIGLQYYSDNAGGVFYGQGVNFKSTMTNSPSSVTLSVSENLNAQNISITDINKYGFFWSFDSVNIGPAKVIGTYTTIGN